MIVVKIHNSEMGLVVALCDNELIGKKFSEGKLILDLNSDFYKGKVLPKEKIISLLKTAYIINAVGKESVELVLKNNYVEKEKIIKIGGIPHAQRLIIK